MYAKPTLVPLDPTAAIALCCHITVYNGDNTIVNARGVCPFPVEGSVCIAPTVTTVGACASS
jgi:hypothetical protein